MNTSAKLVNNNCIDLSNIVDIAVSRMIKKTLVVVDPESNKVNSVNSIEVNRVGELIFKFDDSLSTDSFSAVNLGLTKQITFEWVL